MFLDILKIHMIIGFLFSTIMIYMMLKTNHVRNAIKREVEEHVDEETGEPANIKFDLNFITWMALLYFIAWPFFIIFVLSKSKR